MNNTLDFSSLLTQLAYTDYQLFYFNRDIQSNKQTLIHLARQGSVVKPDDSTLLPVTTRPGDKTNYQKVERYYKTAGRTVVEFMRLNALSRVFLGIHLFSIEELVSWRDYQTYDASQPVRFQADKILNSCPLNSDFQSYLASNIYVQRFAYEHNLYDTYLNPHHPNWFGNSFLPISKLIGYRTDLLKVKLSHDNNLNGTTLLVRTINESFISPAIDEIDRIVEACISIMPMGTAFSKEELVKQYGYPSDNWLDEYIKSSTDSFFEKKQLSALGIITRLSDN